jgi:DNA-binding CsgD family transcriptional regulator
VSGGRRAGLLERERELSELEAAIGAALAGEGGIVLVEGPAGIGKSELLRAGVELARARGARALTARGVELERELAFGAVRQLLEPVLQAATTGDRDRLFAGAAAPARELFEAAAPASGLAADPEFAVLNAVYWLLAGLADTEPLALVIDDAHWLDAPSLRMISFLAPRIAELSVALITATRPPPGEHAEAVLGRLLADPATLRLRPGPLSPAAVRELVSARLGTQPDPAFVATCAEVTGGNPFYLEELLRELELQGVRGTEREAAWVRRIGPRSISLSLRHRGAATDDRAALARALSVLGESHDFGQLAALAGLDRADAAKTADALVRDAIVTAGPPLAFAHPIVRTAVYSAIGPRERTDLHARAGRLLRDAGAPVERVAVQLMRAEPAGDTVVVTELRAAAQNALRQGAPAIAVTYLRRALAEPPDEPTRWELLLELARVEKTALDPKAAEHFTEAYALAPDPRARAQVTLAAAQFLQVSGRPREAIAMGNAILEQLRRDDAALAVELEVELSSLTLWEPGLSGEPPRSFDRSAENLAADSPVARRVLCQTAFRRTSDSEDAARAAELAQRSFGHGLLLSERGTESEELSAAGLTLIYADRLRLARELVDAALAHARTHGARFGFSLVSALAAELSFREGELVAAEADARMSLAISAPAGNALGTAVAAAILIRALVERDALSEALDILHEHDLADGVEFPPLLSFNWLLSDRGRLRLASGDTGAGMADLLDCGRRNREFGVRNPLTCPWRSDLALAQASSGEHDAAQALAQEELAAAVDWGTPGTIGGAKRLLGLLAPGDEQIPLLREAAALLSESPARLEHARALVDLGAALRRANQRAEAREPLKRGLDIADRCGASVLSRRAREELAATGARPRRARLTGLEALTASERRVAEMAARGLGNTDIAQALFVTRKTVEKHLGNAYMKLGVKSRGELPAQLPQASDPERSAQPPRREPAETR